MKNEFKPGELIYLVNRVDSVDLAKFKSTFGSKSVIAVDIETGNEYYGYGFAATPENRQALITLYGEDSVPRLPLSPEELTLKLLENQKYQLCKVSNYTNKEWQSNNVLKAIVHIGVCDEFIDSNGVGWTYGIPIDMNGNEIREIEE